MIRMKEAVKRKKKEGKINQSKRKIAEVRRSFLLVLN
jgi:ribosomal protein L29